MTLNSFLKYWTKNFRLQAFAISVCPVILATSLAFGDGVQDFSIALKCVVLILIVHFFVTLLKSIWIIRFNFEEYMLSLLLGPVLVGLTYYLQSSEMNFAVIFSGISTGLISLGIFILKNIKDFTPDEFSEMNKDDVAKYKENELQKYAYFLIIALLFPILIYLLIRDHILITLCPMLCVIAVPALKNVFSDATDHSLESSIQISETILILFTLLYSFGWIF